MIRLPLLDPGLLLELLTADLAAGELARPATADDIAGAIERLLGPGIGAESIPRLKISPHATVRDVYAAVLDTDAFRLACGRISASYAW